MNIDTEIWQTIAAMQNLSNKNFSIMLSIWWSTTRQIFP